tara:strand:- start:7092 stop:8426 length:1335 start_codon:yes stop_codon:yes gene_type:complete
MSSITIIGGGPAGLAAAHYLKKNKIEFLLYEASNRIGGNCITLNVGDFYFDSGAHRLHDVDRDTTNIFKKLLKDDLMKIDIGSQIFSNNQFIDFPISPLNLLKFLGFRSFSIEGVKILFKMVFKKPEKNDFKSLVTYKYGNKISNLFLLNYSEKLWGVSAEKLSQKISGKRLKGLDLKTFLIELIFGQSKKTKHLDGSFYYPKNGIGSLFEELANYIGNEKLFLNKKITQINHSQQKINSIEINNEENIFVDELISSIPLNVFISKMNPPAPKEIIDIVSQIKFRNVILVVLFLNKERINFNGSMYFPSKEFPFTRIYEPKNRSDFMSPKNKTSLAIEIPCFSTDKIWNDSDDIIISIIKDKLLSIKLIESNLVIKSLVYRINNAYPVLEYNFENNINGLTNYLSEFKNLKILGRNGLFEYSHIHDQFISARNVIKEIKAKNNR